MRSQAALSSMELTCVSCSRSLASSLSSSSSSLTSLRFFSTTQAKGNRSAAARCVRSSVERRGGQRAIEADARGAGGGVDQSTSSFAAGIEVTSPSSTTAIDRSFAGDAAADLAVWEKLGAVVRLSYGIGELRSLENLF